MPDADDKPVVLITGIAGKVGSSLAAALSDDYHVVGFDREEPAGGYEYFYVDLSSDASVRSALAQFRRRHGDEIASVVHLAAYFDFSGEDHPAYDAVNVDGTRRLLRALQDFSVGQLLYSGTMLVHEATEPGGTISEETPVDPKWAYPQSKAEAEEVIEKERGGIPVLFFRLAGLYDDRSAVPTLAHQITRIYERDIQGHLYAGDVEAGQAMLHQEDMVDAFRRAIDRRADLSDRLTLLVGEPEGVGYRELQNLIGTLIHGEEEWATLSVPAPVAKFGAWLQLRAEPAIPDVLDGGKLPFIRPFMIDMASDHYALDVSRAREVLGWEPKHDIRTTLPKIIEALKADPVGWYRANRVDPPSWLEAADEESSAPELLRARAEEEFRAAHAANLWAPLLTVGIGSWLITGPTILDYAGTPLGRSDVASGIMLVALGLLSLSWRMSLLRWLSATVGLWLLFAPLVFRTDSAAGYLNGTMLGALVIGFAVLVRPTPGVGAVARLTGPTVPPGWRYSPSAWTQRVMIIVLAFVGLYISRYLAAYQLGHVDGVWDPFFEGGPDPKNGTEEIITSALSEAWPVPDAGLGAMTYMLEILVGMIGSARRWRTMPWIVVLFGIMIVPLGVVSITFIVIQPILLGTWCTLCLIAAAAMLLQIPYSLDELVATGQFLARRKRAGRSLLRVFFTGDTDEGHGARGVTEFDRPPGAVFRDIMGGGTGMPWNLTASVAIGLWLMLTRVTLGADGGMANADHLIGALIVTVSISAMAEVGRALRFINIGFGVALLITPFAYDAGSAQILASVVCGLALIALSLRRGPVRQTYGNWDRFIR